MSDATSLALGAQFGCAIRTTSEVFCWGRDDQGQLGDGADDDGAVELPPGSVATRIAVGAQSACAIVDGGALYCWGDNARGRLGDGTRADRDAPAAVVDAVSAPILDAVDIAVGFNHASEPSSSGTRPRC